MTRLVSNDSSWGRERWTDRMRHPRDDMGRPPRARATAEAGYSLLEVLVATMLLGFSATSVGGLLLVAVVTQRTAAEQTSLSASAVDQMERLLQLPFEDAALLAGGSVSSSLTGYAQDPYAGDANLYVRWEVVNSSPLMKRITILAGRRDSVSTGTREVRLETFVLKTER